MYFDLSAAEKSNTLIQHRREQSIHYKIGNYKSFKDSYKKSGAVKSLKYLGYIGDVGAGLSIIHNYEAMKSEEISSEKFGYRTFGDISSLAGGTIIRATYGNIWGAVSRALIDGSFWAGEQCYYEYMWWNKEMSKFLYDCKTGLENGTWVPGR